jgi:hypothetical protein
VKHSPTAENLLLQLVGTNFPSTMPRIAAEGRHGISLVTMHRHVCSLEEIDLQPSCQDAYDTPHNPTHRMNVI